MTYNSIKTTESANSSDPDVAVDRIAGKDFQRVKFQWGVEGTATEVDDATGYRLPVNVAQSALIGAVNETAPASDTASSGLNGRLQRVAQRITSLIALIPASLGSKAAAESFAVTTSTEDIARIGSVTETAPGTDTASSGLNGRLQRIAQRITSSITSIDAVTTAVGLVDASVDLVTTAVNTVNTTIGTMSAKLPSALTSAGNLKVALLERTQTSMTYTHTQPSCTSTSNDMLASNANRLYALLTNIGSVDVYLKVNATAVASQGILLQAYGGTYEISPTNNNFTTAVVRGITASGTATVLVTEGT